MPDVKITDSPAQLNQILRPLGITRSSKITVFSATAWL